VRLGSSSPPFVGRREDLELFEGCLREAAGGRPRVVLVRGEAGVGKTRLLKEARPLAERQGVRFCYGRWYEDMVLPGLPFVEALRTLFGNMPEDVGRRLGPDMDIVSGFLREGSVVHLPADPVTSPEAGQHAMRLFLALSRVTIALVQFRPAVLIFDDLHWADRSSLDLLSHLVFAVADAALREAVPLLIMAAYRPVEPEHRLARVLARFEREEICQARELSGFTELEIDQLLQGIGLPHPSHQLVATVSATTEGNPLFVQEVLHLLWARGALQERGGNVVTTVVPEELPVPPELTAAIASRVHALSEACRSVLTLASFLGERFAVSTLTVLTGKGLDELLDVLEEGIRHRVLLAEGQVFEFSHPLMRQALYTEPTEARRQRIHLGIAHALQRESPAGGEAHGVAVAHHLVRAGPSADADTVATWARRAGDYAVSILAWADGARFYEAALAAGESVGRLGAETRAELHYLAGYARYRDLDRGPCLDHYAQATIGYREAGDGRGLAQALAEQARARIILGGVSLGTLIDLRPLQDALEGLGDREPALRGRMWAIFSTAHWTAREPDQAKQMARLALEVGEQLHDDTLGAYASFALAQAHLQCLEAPEALESFQAALAYGRRTQDLWLQGWPLQRLPFIFLMLGRLDDAESAALQASKLARQSHDWSNYSLTQSLLAALAVARGNFRAADLYTSEALTMAWRSHYAWGGVAALLVRACAHWLRGAWEEAEAALDLLVEPGRVFDEPGPALQAIAGLYRQLIQASAAGASGGRSPAGPLQSPVMVGRPDIFSLGSWCAFVELADLQRIRTPTDDLYRRLSEVSERSVVFSSEWLFVIPRVLGIAAMLSGRPEQADAHFQAAMEAAERAGALPELGRSCLGRARFLTARNTGDDVPRAFELVQRAGAIFGELGMGPFARQAADLLQKIEALARATPAPIASRPAPPREVSRPSAGPSPAGRPSLVIAVTDMAGSTELLQRFGDSGAQHLLHVHNDLSRACFRKFGGVELQHTGDGFLASFPSALAAIDCAAAIQQALAKYSRDHSDTPLLVRIALHAGEALPEEGRLYGTAVYATFRMCSHARPGEILVSEAVRQLAAEGDFRFRYRGRFALKGFPDRFRLYALHSPPEPVSEPCRSGECGAG